MQKNMIFKSALSMLVLVGAAACGDSGSTSDVVDDAGSQTTVGDAVAGEALVTKNVCGSCHTGTAGMLAGSDALKGGNLTPDADTGLGSWTDEQIAAAILTGMDDEGEQLCGTMPKYGSLGMTQQDAMNIVAYLKSIPAISNTAAACQ